MGDFGQNAKGGPVAFWPKCPIFMAQLRKPWKRANTYRILAKMVLLDAEFILLFINTKTGKNERLFAEKWYFSDEFSKGVILVKMQRGDP